MGVGLYCVDGSLIFMNIGAFSSLVLTFLTKGVFNQTDLSIWWYRFIVSWENENMKPRQAMEKSHRCSTGVTIGHNCQITSNTVCWSSEKQTHCYLYFAHKQSEKKNISAIQDFSTLLAWPYMNFDSDRVRPNLEIRFYRFLSPYTVKMVRPNYWAIA